MVPGLPLVTGGPYRWFRHPNYVAVVVEGFALPLVHTAWVTALVFTVLNIPLLAVRLRDEERALRRATEPAPLTGPTSPTVDLLVVGGGPVGLVTALEAVGAGLSVVVVEPRTSPVDKACGEGVMPTALARLRALGVEPRGHPFDGITYVGRDGHRVTADFPDGPGLGVRRLELHAALSAAVAAAGVTTVAGTARSVTVRPTHVDVDVDGRALTGRYLAAADGLHSSIRAELGLGLAARGPSRYGLRQHWAVSPWSRHVEVHWAQDAELYVTPVGDDTVGVAVLTAVRGRSYADWLEEFPEVQQRLKGAEPASEVRGAGPLEQRTRRRTAGRVLLVGDAAGYVDAITGEGFAVGLLGARALVDAVRADDPRALRARVALHDEDVATADPRSAPGVAGPVGARTPRAGGRTAPGDLQPGGRRTRVAAALASLRAQVAPSTSWASNSAGWSDIQSAASTVKPAERQACTTWGSSSTTTATGALVTSLRRTPSFTIRAGRWSWLPRMCTVPAGRPTAVIQRSVSERHRSGRPVT